MKFSKTFEVRWADLDANRHMRHTAFNDYGAHVRLAYLTAGGFSAERLTTLEMGPVAFREETLYFKEVGMGEVIIVDIQAAGLSEDGSRWRLRHDIYRKDGVKAATITIDGAWLNLQKRKLMTPPPDMATILQELPKTDDFQTIQRSRKCQKDSNLRHPE